MITYIISLVMFSIPPAITSESSWTSPDIRIVEEWSLNVLDRIEPAYTHLGTVYGVESEMDLNGTLFLLTRITFCILRGTPL